MAPVSKFRFALVGVLTSIVAVSANAEDRAQGFSGGNATVEFTVLAVGLRTALKTYDQHVESQVRTNGGTSMVLMGHGGDLKPQTSLPALLLQGTVPGDVIRIEYGARTIESLGHAVLSLDANRASWEARVSELQSQRDGLKEQIDGRREKLQAPASQSQSAAKRLAAHQAIEKLEKEMGLVEKVLADADLRMHKVRSLFHAARLTHAGAAASGKLSSPYPITYDVLVNEHTLTRLNDFMKVNVSELTVEQAKAAMPSVRIVRLQQPNYPRAQQAIKSVRNGIIGLSALGLIALEEIVVGAIGDQLEGAVRTKPHPESRIEPKEKRP